MIPRNKPSISITLPKAIYEWVELEAKRTNRSRSQMIAALLQAEIDRSASGFYQMVCEDTPAANYPARTSRSPASPMDYVVDLARRGFRSLGLESNLTPGQACHALELKEPNLFSLLQSLAQSSPADPHNLQPFNERFWPFPLKELDTLRAVYLEMWRELHS